MPSALSKTWLSPEISGRDTHQRYRSQVDLGSAFGLPDLNQSLRQFRDVVYMVGSYHSAAEKTLKSYFRSNHKIATYNKLRALISVENNSTDVDSLTITAETALEAVLEFGPAIIPTKDLSGIQIQGEQLATLLRATYSWREEIPGWGGALDLAKQKLAKQGVDPDDALYGMA
ncbi:hypothetical protein [Pseudomonas bohemica]|uniref:hypothetical protein n=1 Tax=Pseudomonas bohemica TaxID=2044872 RepID=UPI000DA63B05|nr:hypothetical protein [Pseudomonas bohemica]